MAQLQICSVIQDIKLYNNPLSQLNYKHVPLNNNHRKPQSNNQDTDSVHSNDSNSLIPSEYQNILLSPNYNLALESIFKCPQNHKISRLSKGRGKCVKCKKDLSTKPCRHCNICNYYVCLQCCTVSASNCVGNHGLSAYSPDCKHDFFCDVCGEEVATNDTMHSCRKCDYDVCSKCYVARTVLHNIDLNNIPLEPHKYDAIFANNYNKNELYLIDNIHSYDNDNEEEDNLIIKDLDLINFDFEFNDISADFNVEKEEDFIDYVVSEIDKIRDEVIDLEEEIYKKKIVIDKLRRIEMNKRSQVHKVNVWMKENKLLWESFKLRWKEWNLECFIEFLKRIQLECSTFDEYYDGNDINCKIKIEKYMETHMDKFGNNIFYGGNHLKLFNELSLYRIGITNDKDCNIIYEEIQKLITFDKKHNHYHRKKKKKSSKKKKKSHRNKREVSDESDDDNYKGNDNELLVFLKHINMEMYYNTLMDDGFDDINALNILEKTDLVQLGMKNGHIKKLLKNVQLFNQKNKNMNPNQIEGQLHLVHYYPSPK